MNGLDPWAMDGFERRGALYVPRGRRRVLQAVDLFCGCGGFSLGMQQAGINVIAAVEWSPTAAITYLYNLGSVDGCAVGFVTDEDREKFHKAVKKTQAVNKKQIPLPAERWIGANNQQLDGSGCRAMVIGDVAKVTASTIHDTLAGIGIRNLPIDVVFGGPPCQGMSRAGRQRPDDARNNYVLEFWRLADELGARVAVMENVPPLMTEKKYRPLFDALVKRANDAGFTVTANVLDAVYYGVPQYRRRTLVVGTRDGTPPFAFPMPTHWPFISTPGGEQARMENFEGAEREDGAASDDQQGDLFGGEEQGSTACEARR